MRDTKQIKTMCPFLRANLTPSYTYGLFDVQMRATNGAYPILDSFFLSNKNNEGPKDGDIDEYMLINQQKMQPTQRLV